MGDEDSRNGAWDCRLEILGEPATASKKSDRTLDDPATRQGLEGSLKVRTFYNFDTPLSHVLHRAPERKSTVRQCQRDCGCL
jgi:hypothetical protein